LSPGYFCDTEYIDYFYNDLSPWHMDYLASLHGFPRTDLSAGFTYCELGCGTGLSLNLHAAANPAGRFYGVDLNRGHIQRATRTARAGQLDNVTFLEEDFAHLLERDLPRFDVIALHGVYSWVSPGIRKEIQAFIGHRLQPGGKVYISYNALPGWGQQAPIRELLVTRVAGMGGGTLEKVAQGQEYLRQLQQANAPIVTSSPQVKGMVDHILTADPRYIAHEYFTAFWEPFYFKQVAEDMTRIGLQFLGCLPVALNYGAFCLPEPLEGFFSSLATRAEFETHKDLVLNTVFRRDVYVQGRGQATAGGGRLAGVRLGSTTALRDFQFQFEVKGNQVRLDSPIFPKLAGLLALADMDVDDLLAHPGLAGHTQAEIVEGLECLVASGQVLPCPAIPQPAPAGLSPLNRHLLERDLETGQGVSLACLPAGTGLTLPHADALVLMGIAEAGLDGAAGWVQEWLTRHNLELATDGTGPTLEQTVRDKALSLPLAQLGLR
jgi:SAM-dependent methyltransferase